ncbi:hypothetical protein PORY_002344 [Pneumocystis oryctolagi]|uniref:Uncharacterized protein n=1 Tax=Pneumocystis oryctolagi TaxID=42067 RepID=A0ACB7CB73_9ASCO|nr:hypothetical protein PORY_002344 [Pneumocystis oryctolagi]
MTTQGTFILIFSTFGQAMQSDLGVSNVIMIKNSFLEDSLLLKDFFFPPLCPPFFLFVSSVVAVIVVGHFLFPHSSKLL